MKRMLLIVTVTTVCVLGLMDIATWAGRQAGTPITGGGQSTGGIGITRGAVQAPGEPYVNCGAATQQYQKLSSALPAYQKHIQDEINRENLMLQQGKEGVTEAQKEENEALFKGAMSEARELGAEAVHSSETLRMVIEEANVPGTYRRKTFLKGLGRVDRLGKKAEASPTLAEQLKNVRGLSREIWALNDYGVKTGLYDYLGEKLAGGFGLAGALGFTATTTLLDVSVAQARADISNGEEQNAGNTINSLKSQLSDFQQRVADLGSNLHQYCSQPGSQQASNNPPDSTTLVRPPKGSNAAKGSVPASAVKAGGSSHALPIVMGVLAGGGVAAYYAGTQLKKSQQNKNCSSADIDQLAQCLLTSGCTASASLVGGAVQECQCAGYAGLGNNASCTNTGPFCGPGTCGYPAQ